MGPGQPGGVLGCFEPVGVLKGAEKPTVVGQANGAANTGTVSARAFWNKHFVWLSLLLLGAAFVQVLLWLGQIDLGEPESVGRDTPTNSTVRF